MSSPNFLGSNSDLAGSTEPALGRMVEPERSAPRSQPVDSPDPAYRKALESPHISKPETGLKLWRVRQKGSAADLLNARRVLAQHANGAFEEACRQGLTHNGANGRIAGTPLSFGECECEVVEPIEPRKSNGKRRGK